MYDKDKFDGKDYFKYLIPTILIIIVSLIVYYKIIIQIEIGPVWDTCDFLSNALFFSGKGSGYSNLLLPPMFPVLTSIFFRLGFISETTIFVVDGALLVFGVLGLYLFFKLRFNHLLSFLGSFLFVTFPLVISYAGAGLSDIPSLSFTIWTLYFTVLAVKRNSKFFYLVFPLAMIAFLTNYSAALIIFPLFFYIFINRECLINLKDMMIGILISLLPVALVLSFYYIKLGNPFYSFINFYGSSSGTSLNTANYVSNYIYYRPDVFYYLKHILSYIGAGGIIIVLILFLIMFFGFASRNKININLKKDFIKIRMSNVKIIWLFSFIVLLVIFIATLTRLPYLASEILFFILSLVGYKLLRDSGIRFNDIDFLFALWFMVFLIFHSVYVIKDDRYFVTMAPAVAYFLLLGLNKISTRVGNEMGIRNLTSMISIILVLMLLISTINYIPGILSNEEIGKEITENAVSSSNWLKNYDPTYKTKIIYADYWPYFGWYLKMNVKPMPLFNDNFSYYHEIENYTVDAQSNVEYNNMLNQNHVDYYFSVREGLNLTNYQPIKEFGNVIIYKRIN